VRRKKRNKRTGKDVGGIEREENEELQKKRRGEGKAIGRKRKLWKGRTP